MKSSGADRARELFDRNKLPAFHDPFAGGGALLRDMIAPALRRAYPSLPEPLRVPWGYVNSVQIGGRDVGDHDAIVMEQRAVRIGQRLGKAIVLRSVIAAEQLDPLDDHAFAILVTDRRHRLRRRNAEEQLERVVAGAHGAGLRARAALVSGRRPVPPAPGTLETPVFLRVTYV